MTRTRHNPHQYHEYRVPFEEPVSARFTQNTVVCPEVALPILYGVVAGKGIEHQGRSRGKHLQDMSRVQRLAILALENPTSLY